ncbi:hypothetical protein AVEN_40171-1 [Araneus ventricosus]|uniref:Uncharacterized protein n=1 Tax=Araneus ventricosus TaxID=182803 RepID=A0A4Y2PFW6_ARAVE|nr:hypothetical protein AVEN_40171-1 [Araneus ventricosus]
MDESVGVGCGHQISDLSSQSQVKKIQLLVTSQISSEAFCIGGRGVLQHGGDPAPLEAGDEPGQRIPRQVPIPDQEPDEAARRAARQVRSLSLSLKSSYWEDTQMFVMTVIRYQCSVK